VLLNEPLADLNAYMVSNDNIEPGIVRGEGAEVWDEDGKVYVDLEGGPGVTSVGHCHPDVVAAIRDQAGLLLQVPGRFHSRNTLSLAKRIADYAAGPLTRTFFVNSGAEAAEGAVKLAMKYRHSEGAQGFGIIALQHGFHGRLGLSISLTGLAKGKKGMGTFGLYPGVAHVPAPYCYRCPLGLSYPSCGVKCADLVEDAMQTSVAGEAAVVIGEPILGVGGIIVPPQEYWPKVESICRKYGSILIMDEVFTGFGRTGKAFAHQHYGISPDIMTFAKAIGGGVPLGGFIATQTLGDAFKPGDHSTTYGGKNQLGIAAGHAVLSILAKEALAENAAMRGAQFVEGLTRLQTRYPQIGDIRGKGLFLAIELIKDEARTPDAAGAKALSLAAIENGILVSTTGLNANIIRITPPLVVTAEHVDRALASFERAFVQVYGAV
jgi:4-aminobutyrate aminotransferase / (S)-3-amino-2-methylpropionate transaminase / 5-aminovalerate transaminase